MTKKFRKFFARSFFEETYVTSAAESFIINRPHQPPRLVRAKTDTHFQEDDP